MNIRLSYTKAQQEKGNKLKKMLVPVSSMVKEPKAQPSMEELEKLFAPKGKLNKKLVIR